MKTEARKTAQKVADALSAFLTPREREVLGLVAGGCTYKKAADSLGISLHTVRTHIKNSYRKLEVHSGGAAVMRAMQLGLLQLGARS